MVFVSWVYWPFIGTHQSTLLFMKCVTEELDNWPTSLFLSITTRRRKKRRSEEEERSPAARTHTHTHTHTHTLRRGLISAPLRGYQYGHRRAWLHWAWRSSSATSKLQTQNFTLAAHRQADRTPAGRPHGWTAGLQCALGNGVFHQHPIRGSCQAEQKAVLGRNSDKDIDTETGVCVLWVNKHTHKPAKHALLSPLFRCQSVCNTHHYCGP